MSGVSKLLLKVIGIVGIFLRIFEGNCFKFLKFTWCDFFIQVVCGFVV